MRSRFRPNNHARRQVADGQKVDRVTSRPATPTLNVAPSLNVSVTLDKVFAESCLPATTALAERFRLDIVRVLDDQSATWPFDDRVLVWLLPSLRKDVAA